jgi:hypothetical protein
MTQTLHLSLPLLAAAQAQKHVTHNEAPLTLDAITNPAATSDRTFMDHARRRRNPTSRAGTALNPG